MTEENEEAELWRKHREASQEKKAGNLQNSTQILKDRGVPFKVLSSIHYRVGDWDFWASTGLYIHRATGKRGRGVFNLIKLWQKNKTN